MTTDWIPLADAARRLAKDPSTLRRHIATKHFSARKDSEGTWSVHWPEASAYYAKLPLRNTAGHDAGPPVAHPGPAACTTQGPQAGPLRGPPADPHAIARLETRVAELEGDLARERGKREYATEKIYLLTEQVVSLSSKVVGLLEAAGTAGKERKDSAPRQNEHQNATATMVSDDYIDVTHKRVDTEVSHYKEEKSARKSTRKPSKLVDDLSEAEDMLTTGEAAKLTGIPRQTILSRAKRGEIPSVTKDGKTLFRRQDLPQAS